MINVAIIGFGYWGKNLVRNFNALDSCEVTYVCEKDTTKAEKCIKLYPNINVVSDYNILLKDETVEAIVIATPVDTHCQLAKAALKKGKHVLVEKPLTSSFAEAKELKELANSLKLLIMVDHTFLYTGAVRYLKEQVDNGVFGNINYVDSTRINLGLFQHDVNVLWDLAPHDISICNWLINKKPISVQATGISHTDNNIENIAFLTLKYEDNTIAHFNCSWVSPVKIRQMLIGGDKKMVAYNDMEPTEKIKVYDTGFKVRSDEEKQLFNADYRVGDIHVPKIQTTEALLFMAKDFINCIINETKPDSDVESGVKVVEILEKAEYSIKNKGIEVTLS
jgi:predicted dehydrogenase